MVSGNRLMQLSYTSIVIALLVLVSQQAVATETPNRYKLILVSGNSQGSECIKSIDARLNAYITGMVGMLEVLVMDSLDPMGSFTGIHDRTWPHGLVIEACTSATGDTANFQHSPDVYNKLNLRFYLDAGLVEYDSLWKKGEADSINPFAIPHYCFHYDVLPELAGRWLCFRVHYSSDRFGNLTSDTHCYQITAPCSKKDSLRVLRNHITSFGFAGDYQAAFAYGDSLLALGQYDRTILFELLSDARKIRNLDSCLHYMNLEFEHYGNYGMINAEKIQPITPESRAEFEQQKQREVTRFHNRH
jgi:hypothetical protein